MILNLLKAHSWRRWSALVVAFLLLALVFGFSTGDAEASGHLWDTWYWNNAHLAGEPVYNVMEPIGFDPGLSSPHPGIVSADDFSARFLKTISVDSAGNYTFVAHVDDGIRVWVDGNLLIDNWVAAALHEVSATTSLAAGEHEVRVEYFDTRDNAALLFDWGPAGTVQVGEPPAAPPAAPTGNAGADFMGDGPLATVGEGFRLNVRRGPSVLYPVITSIGAGTQVEFLYRWEAGMWTAIELPDGRVGWVNATYLNADFATGELPEWTRDPEVVLTAAPGVAAPTEIVGDQPLATVGSEFRLNVRRGPGVEYSVLTTIDGGTEVEMLYRWLEGFWIAVRLPDGQIGWVNATYLNADFPTGDLPAWTGEPENALAGATPDQPSAPAGGEGAGFMGPEPLAFVGTGLRLNVRTGPGVEYPVVETIAGGTTVEMLYRWESGRWIAIELPNGEVGWVNATYLHADFATGDLPAYTGDPEAIAGNVQVPVAAPGEAFGTGPRAFVGQDFRLNLRQGPDVTHAVIDTLPGNTEVEMIYRWQSGRWVAVRLVDGTIGWVNATYLNADFATGELPEWVDDPVLVLDD